MTRDIGFLRDLLARITDTGRGLLAPQPPAATLTEMCEGLLSSKGEATGLAQASAILDAYAKLSEEKRRGFFADLRDRFGADPAAVTNAIERWKSQGPAALRAVHFASEPRSQEVIRRLNRAPGGTARLVVMRNDLLALIADDPSLAPLDADFRHLFSSWFNRGFLELRRIDWSTPASILEKIIQYEAVHEITGWDDLRRRVAAADRRLYAFFHPALDDDPLIFVEVALTEKVPNRIQDLLSESRAVLDPVSARAAVFYSISNCQDGLRGVSFGNFLIKQVVEELQREFSQITTFVTLSPVPGLRKWVSQQVREGALSARQLAAAQALEQGDLANPGLIELAAQYLVKARGKNGGAFDPVARFHLGNGARLEAIHTQADTSAKGIEGSWGVMVNYLYEPSDIERNHEAYSNRGEIIVSASVRRLVTDMMRKG